MMCKYHPKIYATSICPSCEISLCHPCGHDHWDNGHKPYKKKVVLCHGCFDVLHIGHIKYLEAAKKYGDRLIVSITADKYVNKGPGRPYFNEQQRKDMLDAIGIIDEVFIVDGPTALEAIKRYTPDFYVKGPDYRDASQDPTGEIINERKEVESYGGKVIFTEEETHSSSNIINKCFREWTEAQKEEIQKVMANGGFRAVTNALEKLKDLRVLVVGEPILDVYRFVRPEGISSKSPSISCRFEREESYQGGAGAINNHLSDFCSACFLPGYSYYEYGPKKIRYISGNQRVFEVTEIDDDFCALDKIPSNYDCYVVADFGHGMFRGGELENINGFVGLNVQTNSSNFGFNVYQKHKKFDYLCLDTREARLAMHDRYSHPISVAQKIKEDICKPFGFTCGAEGAYLFYGAQTYYSPAFSDVVVDATGAGDAYFAITTVLLASGCNPELVPFIGNVFAGLKTKIIGNKESVSKASLLKAIKAILA